MRFYQPSHTCRFCGDWKNQDMVKYGVRHYAHFRCYLDAGKTLDDLWPWQVGEFPHKLLKERGLLAVASEIVEREKREKTSNPSHGRQARP